jgi:hypothetical protein
MGGLISYLRAAFETQTPDHVIFAGVEPMPLSNHFEFGFYNFISKSDVVWMPGYAIEPEIIDQLRDLSVGASFRIIEEESQGQFGTMVHRIEITPHDIVYDLSDDNGVLPHVDDLPGVLKL